MHYKLMLIHTKNTLITNIKHTKHTLQINIKTHIIHYKSILKPKMLTSTANSMNSFASNTTTAKPIKRELGSFIVHAPPLPRDLIVLLFNRFIL